MGNSKHLVTSCTCILRGLLLLAVASALLQSSPRPRQLKFPFNPHSKGPLFSRHVALDPSEGADEQACIRKCSRDKSCSVAIAQPRADGPVSCVHLFRQVQSIEPSQCKSERSKTQPNPELICEHGIQTKEGVCVCREPHTGQVIEYEKPDRCNSMSRNIFFDESTVHRGRFYLFGLHNVPSAQKAQEVCGWYGGYLAEIDDEDEDNFVKNVTYRQMQTYRSMFWLGGSDEGHEGTWVFPRTGKPVNVTSWFPGQPDNHRDNEHCLTYFKTASQSESKGGQGAMNDYACNAVDSGTRSIRFICEIPC